MLLNHCGSVSVAADTSPLSSANFCINSSRVISPRLNQQFRQCVSLRKAGDKKFFQGDRSFTGFAIVLPQLISLKPEFFNERVYVRRPQLTANRE
jgi:hypothetical protein